MKEQLKDKILSIRPEYSTEGFSSNPLPNEVSIYYEGEDFTIDLFLDINEVLRIDILEGEDAYDLSDEDINFLCGYLSGLLEYEIQITKNYYDAERGQQDNYYYYS
jgi:hypothetical protein